MTRPCTQRRSGPDLTRLLVASFAGAGLVGGLASCRDTHELSPEPAAETANIEASTPAEADAQVASPAASNTTDRSWADGRVFYLAFVRSFQDSTEGPLANDGVGDIRGMISRLDYLQDLGVRGLWLMPVAQSPSYHGYDTTDYRTIDDEYGTNEDFKELMREAHKRDIRVVVDLVVNHSSWEHPWFVESTDPESDKRDWYTWSETKPDYLGPWNQPVWHDHKFDDAGAYFYGVFWHGMPDLNYHNPEVTAEMHDIARFWIEEMGADGFRLDAIKHLIEDGPVQENTPETVEWFRGFGDFLDTLETKQGDRPWIVGEVWSDRAAIASYITPDANGNRAPIDSAFDFPMAYAIMESLRDGTPERIRRELQESWDTFGGQAATFISNHDMDRAFTQWDRNIEKARAAATILMLMPGTPFIFYGEEIGMQGGGPHEKLRTPMQWTDEPGTAGFTEGEPWTPVYEDGMTVEAQTGDGRSSLSDRGSLLEHYRDLMWMRNHIPAIQYGDFELIDHEDPRLIAFARTHTAGDRRQAVIVVVNVSDQTIGEGRAELIAPNGKSSLIWEELRPFDYITGRFGTTIEPADNGP